MARIDLKTDSSCVVVVDIQPAFMAAMSESDRTQSRAQFLVDIAHLLEIPILATEQNRSKMGETAPSIASRLSEPAFDKMSFSCVDCEAFMDALFRIGRKQIILVGIETHICVSQTALDLQSQGYEVVVCPDAVSARTMDRHKLGMERIRDAGIVPAHTEAVTYEWMRTADHPRFRDALKLVKDAEF